MQESRLTAQKREIVGRKVKKLREQGLIPANVFGKNIPSMAVSVKRDEFMKVYNEVGETGVIKLQIEGEKSERPILIQNVQFDPLTELPLHADLRQIVLTEKVRASIPVELTGESPAVEQKIGILIQTVKELEVEALPMDLPERFVVDISNLKNVGDIVTVKDLSYDKSKVEILAEDEEMILAKIEPLAEEEVAPAPAEGEEKVAEEAAVEGGEAPAAESGEEKKEEKKE